MRIIRSVRDARGNVFQKQPTGGAGRLRCSRCSGVCTAQRLPNGKQVMRCGSCGASYTTTPLGGARAPVPGAVPKRIPR
jgi:hypothetical protein